MFRIWQGLQSRLANFTNEGGVDGRIRYLRNVMGLWLLQESIRTWESTGDSVDLTSLLREAANVPPFTALVDPDEPIFLPPGDIPSRIVDTCRASGQPTPGSPPEVVRCSRYEPSGDEDAWEAAESRIYR